MDASATYTLARGEQRYGPYTLEQLREYVKQGSIQPNDIVWSEGMTTWRAVSEVLEPIAPASALAMPPPLPTSGVLPRPPSLHWGFVLLLTLVTCFVFALVWAFVQAIWVKRIDRTSKAIWVLAIGVPIQIVLAIASQMSVDNTDLLDLLGGLTAAFMTIWAYFDMRATIEARFDLDLSGLMTFFFNVFYLQHHMTRIAKNEHVPRSQRILG